MVRSRTAEFALAIVGLSVAIFFLSLLGDISQRSFGDPLGSRLVPSVACTVLIILSIVIAVRAAFIPRPARSDWSDKATESSSSLGSVAIVLVAACLFAAMMPVWGYYLDVWLLGLVVVTLGRPRAWRQNLVSTSIITLLFYLVFGLGLSVVFPRAFILNWF